MGESRRSRASSRLSTRFSLNSSSPICSWSRTSTGSGRVSSRLLAWMNSMPPMSLWWAISRATSMKSECSTAYTFAAPARLAMKARRPVPVPEVEHHVTRTDMAMDRAVVRVDAHPVAQHLLVLGETGEVGLVHQVVHDAHEPIARRDPLGAEPNRRADRPGGQVSRVRSHHRRVRAAMALPAPSAVPRAAVPPCLERRRRSTAMMGRCAN